MADIVYILTNQAFIEDLIKVGWTKDLEKRIRDLSSPSSIPVPFECYFACEVEDGKGKEIERRLHFGFGDRRHRENREFFRVDPERVKTILEGWMTEDVTPKDIKSQGDAGSIKRGGARKPNFNFPTAQISIGAELNFVDDESIICHVAGDRKVKFKGKEMFLNEATLLVLNNEPFNRGLKAIRGPTYWLFDGEALTDRRTRLEQSDDAT